jgi:hypothetical protein
MTGGVVNEWRNPTARLVLHDESKASAPSCDFCSIPDRPWASNVRNSRLDTAASPKAQLGESWGDPVSFAIEFVGAASMAWQRQRPPWQWPPDPFRPHPSPLPRARGLCLARVDSRERGHARLSPLGFAREGTVRWVRAGLDRILLHPVGGEGPRRGDEGANRANHEPVTANTTRVAGDPAGGAVGSLFRPAANEQPA